MKNNGNFKKIIIWSLVILIAFGYNFSSKFFNQEDVKIKITPQKESFKSNEKPCFSLEINSPKNLWRFFKLVMLSRPVAMAEEKTDFIEEFSLKDTCDSSGCHSEPALAGEESRGNAETGENNNIQPVAPSEILPRQEANQVDNSNDGIAALPEADCNNITTTVIASGPPNGGPENEVIPKADPSLADNFNEGSILGEATTSQNSLIEAFAEGQANASQTATTIATTTQDSLFNQAVEQIGNLIEKIKEVASKTGDSKPIIEVAIYNPEGEILETVPQINKIEDNQYEVVIEPVNKEIKSGDYQIEVKVEQGDLSIAERQQFGWGKGDGTEDLSDIKSSQSPADLVDINSAEYLSQNFDELLIKIGENSDLPGSFRDGDIVEIRPAGHPRGSDEEKEFLFVRVPKLTDEEKKEFIKNGCEENSNGVEQEDCSFLQRLYKIDYAGLISEDELNKLKKGEFNQEKTIAITKEKIKKKDLK